MITVKATLHTNGQGYWSSVAQAVRITGISLGWVNAAEDAAELRVYFNSEEWDVQEHGLIYTDPQFRRELRSMLNNMQLDGDFVSYSEHGMQGTNYVSLDADDMFIIAYKALYPEDYAAAWLRCNN